MEILQAVRFCVTITLPGVIHGLPWTPLKFLNAGRLRRGSWASRVYDRTDSFSVLEAARLGAADREGLVGPVDSALKVFHSSVFTPGFSE